MFDLCSVITDFSSKATGCMPAVLVEVGSFVDLGEVFCFYYLWCERLFLGELHLVALHNFKYTFYFNLIWKERFLESTLRGWIFDK